MFSSQLDPEVERELRDMKAQIRALRPDLPRFTAQDARRYANRPFTSGDQTFQEGLLGGDFTIRRGTEARTDTAAADGTMHAYSSGATIVLQIFDKDAGAWRSVTLS